MRTNIVIDNELLQEAFRVTNARTKKELVHEALRELIRLKKRKNLSELAGSVEFYKGYNHKQLRKTRGCSWLIPPFGLKFSETKKEK